MEGSSALSLPMPPKLPVVAIVGRPNVGKSTLFNRLVRERKAIVDDTPGITRDRNYAEAQYAGRRFKVIDTGGLESGPEGNLEQRVQEQSRLAVAEADVVVFLLDGKGGLSPLDREAVDYLRSANKPAFFAVNKIDSRQRADNLYEFYALGIDRLYSISAEHGLGVSELLSDVIEQFPDATEAPGAAVQADKPPRVAVVGRPNVGKSTLINRLLGFERSIVDATPGTTRDALDTPFEIRGRTCTLVDTAGIRRKARIHETVERFSVNRSLRMVDEGDLIIDVIDAVEGVTDQDAQILSYAARRGKALLLAVNKWDLVGRTVADTAAYQAGVRHKLAFLDYAPVAFISAATGYGIRKMLDAAARTLDAYEKKVPTAAVNQALQQIVKAHAAPLRQGKPVKFYYGTQTGVRPPTFTFFVNHPGAVPESYQRYLLHQLRANLDLDCAPIRLFLRARRDQRSGREKS
jgi:GTP-binding protein